MSLSAEIGQHFSLSGRTAVITGAASGLGREAARLFALAGAQVVITDIDTNGLEATAATVGKLGGAAIVHRTDVSQRSDVETLADLAVRECGQVDSWINAAGIPYWAEILDSDTEAAERLIAINMMGTFWCCPP